MPDRASPAPAADLWTAEGVELVAIALFLADWPDETADAFFERLYESAKADYCRKAERVLAALAEAGRRRPGDAREEWAAGTRYRIMPGTPDRREAEAQLRSYGTADGSALLRRWVGPWLPVGTEEQR